MKVIVANPPTKEQAKEIIKRINKILEGERIWKEN